MAVIAEMIEDAQYLAAYATTHQISLPGNTLQDLLFANSNASEISTPGPSQTAFFSAYNAAVSEIGQPASAIRAAVARRQRIRLLMADAQVLLGFAASNGRKVEDAVRNPIVEINSAMDDGTLTMNQEQEFLKAFEGLTTTLAPITVETLMASKTVLPNWPFEDWKTVRRWSLGRFFNVLIFGLVLLGTCISLSYYAQGAYSLKRYESLKSELAIGMEKVVLKNTDRAETRAQPLSTERILEINTEIVIVAKRLRKWAALPCAEDSNWIFTYFFCSLIDREQNPPDSSIQSVRDARSDVEAARTVAGRLNEVYLPLLLGWLGAHAFILRNMSRAITERSFAPGSAFNHVVRTGLGALAGLASVWLLTPQGVGGTPWTTLPIWALAFVAGYGIELVFNFMDRVISAFGEKS